MTSKDPQSNHPQDISTYFAPADRLESEQILQQINNLGQGPIVNSLIKSFGCVVAVLNEHRQILAINDSLLKILGLPNVKDLLGLRPGEALQCSHANDNPGGCGTSKYCSTCGAAIAIVTAQTTSEPQERECLLTITDKEISLELSVRAEPLEMNEEQLVLLMLVDIRDEKRRQSLEHTFFHDLNNVLSSLVLSSKSLKTNENDEIQEHIKSISTHVDRIVDEVRCQQFLSNSNDYKPQIQLVQYPVSTIINEIKLIFLNYVKSSNPILKITALENDLLFRTDKTLLNKVLMNMIKNALEASNYQNEVCLWCDVGEDSVTWNVRNQEVIPEKIAMRIFQRYFSTKKEKGHGLGTHSMKLFGEKYLEGKVTFISTEEERTVFSFNHPISIKSKNAAQFR